MKKEPGRCTGHCCTCVTIPFTPAELKAQYDVPRGTPGRKPDIDDLYEMLIPLGDFPANPLMKVHKESWAEKALRIGTTDKWRERKDGNRGHERQFFYTCRHLQMNGDCGNYEKRPAMCRDYPNGHICGFTDCTMPIEDQVAKASLDLSWVASNLVQEIKGYGLIPPMSLVRKAKKQDQRMEKVGKELKEAEERPMVVKEVTRECTTVTLGGSNFVRPSMKMRVGRRKT